MSVHPTVRADYRNRVLGFSDRAEALTEARAWRTAGFRARVVTHKGVHNVIVSVPT